MELSYLQLVFLPTHHGNFALNRYALLSGAWIIPIANTILSIDYLIEGLYIKVFIERQLIKQSIGIVGIGDKVSAKGDSIGQAGSNLCFGASSIIATIGDHFRFSKKMSICLYNVVIIALGPPTVMRIAYAYGEGLFSLVELRNQKAILLFHWESWT